MSVKVLIASAATIGMTALSALAEPMMLTTEEAFRQAVVDRPLIIGDNEIIVNSNGQVVGRLRDGPITASKWTWSGTKFCRALRTASRDFPSECQDVTMEGDNVSFGEITWTIK